MSSSQLLLCFVALFVGAFSFDIDSERAVSGTPATLGQFPHHVILRNVTTNRHFCSGTIITPRAVLTAAHCVHNILSLRSFDIVYGQLAHTPPRNAKRVEVSDRRIHSGYDHSNSFNDIAVLLTRTEFPFGKNVQVASLPPGNVNLSQKLHITGWSRYRVSVFQTNVAIKY